MMAAVQSFPSLSEEEFRCAAHALRAKFESCPQSHWRDTQLEEIAASAVCIRIQRVPEAAPALSEARSHAHADVDDEISEDDEDAAKKMTPLGSVTVTYSILRSPSYQVPTLYFDVSEGPTKSRPSLDRIHDLLVPPHLRDAVLKTGILGAVSLVNHPLDDVPCFFVHPCRTIDALNASKPSGELTAWEYFQLWFGIIGQAVGLSLPLEFIDRSLS